MRCTITDSILENIYKNGKYYNPAWTHYNIEKIFVTCDRCQRTQLNICIGWGKQQHAKFFIFLDNP
jgi:hypothetical protein